MTSHKNRGRLQLTCLVWCCLALSPALGQAHDYPYDEGGDQGPGEGQPLDRFFLGFSVGQGAYFNYRCGQGYGCDDVYVTPLDMELLLGMRLGPLLYLDLGMNMGVDYSYYDQVAFLAGIRPGIRLVFPLPFHRTLYFRGAIPVQYSAYGEYLLLGLLLGFGAEWVLGNVGWFIEGDITPYFFRIYPDHYAIPAQVRLGFSVRF